jgi:hypothetical protein
LKFGKESHQLISNLIKNKIAMDNMKEGRGREKHFYAPTQPSPFGGGG